MCKEQWCSPKPLLYDLRSHRVLGDRGLVWKTFVKQCNAELYSQKQLKSLLCKKIIFMLAFSGRNKPSLTIQTVITVQKPGKLKDVSVSLTEVIHTLMAAALMQES